MTGPHDLVVDERRRAEAALRETEERFRVIFDTARDCIFVKDLGLRYTHVNPAMASLFSRPAQELIGTTDDQLFDDATVARVRDVDRRVLEGVVCEEVNTSLVRGVEYVFHTVKVPLRDMDGRVIGLCGIARDITQLKRAEKVERMLGGILNAAASSADLKTLISEIRELLGTLLDTANFYVALYDEASDRYSFPYYVDEYDELEQWEPMPQPKSLTDYVRRTGRAILVDAEEFAELERRGEVELVGTDSKQWLGAPLVTERGVIGVVVVQSYHDASLYSEQDLELLHYAAGTISIALERKRGEERRRTLESKLLQMQKMESLGVLAGGIAHEFNNLLQSILGSTGLASRLLPATSPVQRQLEMIEKAANDAAQLTRQMLAYSGKSGFVIEEIDAADLVGDMREFLGASVPDSVEIRFDLGERLPLVKADPAEFRQVVVNLVTNAAEAIGDLRGSISINVGAATCDRATLDDTSFGQELPEGSYVFLDVRDTGCGMEPATQAKIFDPFFSTKFAGRGLGLAAVVGIVRSLGGTIRVRSAPGRGTAIRVLLPTAAPASAADARPDRSLRAGTVLVVDDDDVVRSLTRQMLEEAGFDVLVARDGRGALEVFGRSGPRIDVVLLDMTMPRMDGETTFKELRQIDRDVRVIVTSGYSEHDSLTRFGSARPAGYLQKPYRMTELLGAIHDARRDQGIA